MLWFSDLPTHRVEFCDQCCVDHKQDDRKYLQFLGTTTKLRWEWKYFFSAGELWTYLVLKMVIELWTYLVLKMVIELLTY